MIYASDGSTLLVEPKNKYPIHWEMFMKEDIGAIEDARANIELARPYFSFYRELVEELEIESIFEIGVRAGYSMFNMLSGNPEAFYRGVDIDADASDSLKGAYKHARYLISEYFPKADAKIIIRDSHSIKALPRLFDLAHIDGDHSLESVLSDLELTAPIAKRIIIDDYSLLVTVMGAVNLFLDLYDERYDLKPAFYDTWRGTIILNTQSFMKEFL